jgi:hypothetical protein
MMTMTNAQVEYIRAILARGETVAPADIAALCDEAEALQDVLNRIAKNDAERAYQKSRRYVPFGQG